MARPRKKPMSARFNAEGALKLAKLQHAQGILDNAESIYDGVLAIAPNNADALHFKGVLSHQRGRSDEALALIRQSLALDASVPDWHYNLGNVLFATGKADDAVPAYEEALRLAPERADFHHNLGVAFRKQGRSEAAEAAFRRSLELNPNNPNAHHSLGQLLGSLGREDEATRCLCEALVLGQSSATSRNALGRAYWTLGRYAEAAEVYRQWLKEEPDSPQAAHYLAACSGEGIPARAADAYVENVFDDFAERFDAKLANLHYRAPELVTDTVASLLGDPQGSLTVLDAGCGTGLCGPLLAPFAQHLHGVDLSARMLEKAAVRGVYETLVKAELTAHIEAQAPASHDLIVSADTLCYFGDLGAVAHAAARALKPGGWLVFTVEAVPDEEAGEAGFRLNSHGRYSHGERYLEKALADAGLTSAQVRAAHLRTEAGKPVDGFVVSARR